MFHKLQDLSARAHEDDPREGDAGSDQQDRSVLRELHGRGRSRCEGRRADQAVARRDQGGAQTSRRWPRRSPSSSGWASAGCSARGVGPDDKDPTAYIAQFGQSGLGLPDRDYYLKPDAALAKIRPQYVAYVAKLLTLAGEPDADARAAAIMAFETKMAQAHWSRIDSRDADKTYNKWTRADFDAKAPGFPWKPYLAGLGVDAQPTFLVAQPTAFTGEAAIFAQTPLPVLKDYMLARIVTSYAKYLSSDVVAANFAFKGTVLSGTPENQARWKRGVGLVSSEMGEAVGQDYVAAYFPPEAKAAADALVHNIIAAFGQRIRAVTWMDPATKQKALAKLAAFTPKIGYPTKWRDYSTLVIKPGDLVGNVARAEAFEYQRNLNKLGNPIDRTEWGMTPMEINAYANPVMNEIVFPAAILQPPFFDPKADPAVNYGGIGAVIGHELSHHFDDQGRKYDLTGKLTDWWTPQDVSRFTALTDELVKQYDGYEPLPGQHVQGALTLGENMADLNGLKTSYDAYQLSLGGKAAPVLDGFYRRRALLSRLGAGVAHQVPRAAASPAAAHRSAFARHAARRRGPQHGSLVQGVRRYQGRDSLSAARRARAGLVGATRGLTAGGRRAEEGSCVRSFPAPIRRLRAAAPVSAGGHRRSADRRGRSRGSASPPR